MTHHAEEHTTLTRPAPSRTSCRSDFRLGVERNHVVVTL
jgi:hypothetical protein